MASSSAPTGLNLTQVTYFGRQGLKVVAILIISLMVGRFLLNGFTAFWNAVNPPPPPPPTVGFGAIPALKFPSEAAGTKPKSYQLETATGGLPQFGDRAKVLLMPKQSSGLLDDENAKKIGSSLGFVFKPEVIGQNTYRWTKLEPLQSVLEMDLPTKHFALTTSYASRPDLLLNTVVPDTFTAVSSVKAFLQKATLLPQDIATVSGETKYLKAVGAELQEAVSYSDADYVQVELTRYPIDGEYFMVTPQGTKGTIHAIVGGGGSTSTPRIIEMEMQHFAVDYSQVETYPLRSVQAAWKVVQAGEGYVAAGKPADIARIREVYLAYFDDFSAQDYLQPVFVFAGDDGVMVYVSAIDPKYTL